MYHIEINDIKDIALKTKWDDKLQALITTITIKTELVPSDIGNIAALSRQVDAVAVTLESLQATLPLGGKA